MLSAESRFRATACCQPPPRPSNARTARPISASVRVAKRGEPVRAAPGRRWGRRHGGRHRERRRPAFRPLCLPPADCDHTRSRRKSERHRGGRRPFCLMTWHPDDVASENFGNGSESAVEPHLVAGGPRNGSSTVQKQNRRADRASRTDMATFRVTTRYCPAQRRASSTPYPSWCYTTASSSFLRAPSS